MSYSSNYALNVRVSNLEWEVNQLGPIPPGGFTLSDILTNGNSAGTNNINLNGNNLQNANNVTTNTITCNGVETINTALGPTATASLVVNDTVANQELIVLPNASGGAYNASISADDVAVIAKGSTINTKNLTLACWSSNNSFVKMTPTYVQMGYGGTVNANPTNGITFNTSGVTVQSPTFPVVSGAAVPPTSDNSTKLVTSQWVQNLFATIPSPVSIIPYLWGMSQNYSTFTTGGGQIYFNFTGASWGNNQYFTIRFQLEQSYILGANGTFPYFQSWSGLIDVYPNRITATNTTAAVCLLNGTINGNAAYSLTDPTYAPSGRYYWTRDYSNSSSLNTGSPTPVSNPISIMTTANSQFFINIVPPISVNPGAWRQSVTIELIQQGGLPVTTSGVPALFSGGSYYTSF